jgi:hypothetical protein
LTLASAAIALPDKARDATISPQGIRDLVFSEVILFSEVMANSFVFGWGAEEIPRTLRMRLTATG